MKTFMYIALAILVVPCILLFGACADESDDDDDDDDNDHWPDDLSPCGDYADADPWFEIPDFYDVAMDFQDQFIDDADWRFIQGVATVAGSELSIEIDDWTLTALWTKTDADLPIENGQTIYVIARRADADQGTAVLWIVDKERNTLLYQSTTTDKGWAFYEGDDLVQLEFDYDLTCEYRNPDALPPDGGDYGWERVFGRSVEGTVTGSAFFVERPGQSAITDDGSVEVYLPYSYSGETDYDRPVLDGDYPGAHLLQMVAAADE